MAPTNTTIRNAKPKAKPYKLTDEKGLFLLVQPSGGMLWRFKFRIDGRDEATIDGVAKSLARFEESTRGKDFKRFHREQAVAFKAQLGEAIFAC